MSNVTATIPEKPKLATWYACPVTGGEYAFNNPFEAHSKLNELNVAGNLELRSALTGQRDIKSVRRADGTWTEPEKRGPR